jgi:hypothetical protein
MRRTGVVNPPIRPDCPADILDALKDHPNSGLDGNLPFSGCRRLLWDFHHPPDAPMSYTWGFRIYRTTYCDPSNPISSNNDVDFARAIETLHEYMRHELFSYDHGQRRTPDHASSDNTAQTNAKNVLWRCLQNEIVQNRALLEGASPEKIIGLARQWFPTQYQGAKVVHSSAHRYPLIIDDEVLQNLLALPTPAEYVCSEAATYTIKVCDLRVDDDDSDDEEYMSSDDEDEDMCSEEDDGYRGWFWIGAFWLVGLWFDEGNAATEEVCSWDEKRRGGREEGGERRFLFWLTKMDLGCGHSVAEHRVMYPSIFQDEDEVCPEVVDHPLPSTTPTTTSTTTTAVPRSLL